jgi:hypothetical protein
MSDPELHEISSIAPKWDPHWAISRRGVIVVSERVMEREHENYDLQHDLSDVDLAPDSWIVRVLRQEVGCRGKERCHREAFSGTVEGAE